LIKVLKKDFESIQNYKSAFSFAHQKNFIIETVKTDINKQANIINDLNKVETNDDNVTVSKSLLNDTEVASIANKQLFNRTNMNGKSSIDDRLPLDSISETFITSNVQEFNNKLEENYNLEEINYERSLTMKNKPTTRSPFHSSKNENPIIYE
jgi:hypothetical protein